MGQEITFYDHPPMDEDGRSFLDDGKWFYPVSDLKRYRETVAKIRTAYLGPWCPTCGKKGDQCKNRDKCIRRSILLKPGPKFVTLPHGRSYQRLSKQEVQANAYRECVKRGDPIREAVAA